MGLFIYESPLKFLTYENVFPIYVFFIWDFLKKETYVALPFKTYQCANNANNYILLSEKKQPLI